MNDARTDRAAPDPAARHDAAAARDARDDDALDHDALDACLPPAHRRRLGRVRGLARTLDAQFKLPLIPIRFGADSLIGLVPVVGDTLTAAAAGYIVLEARRCDAPPELVGRMLANIGIDWAIGLVPLAGDLLDVGFKANQRNARLLATMLHERHTARTTASA